MRWGRLLVGVVTLALLPSVAEAHGIDVGGLWVDETGVLIPAVVLMVLVMKIGGKRKPTKSGQITRSLERRRRAR